MFFECLPWQLDVDIESTKLLYKANDYSKNSDLNTEFMESLTLEQKNFFDALGVDLSKIEIDQVLYDIPEEKEMPALKMKRVCANFLIKGKFLALPQYQKDLYSDEEVFGEAFPDSMKVVSCEEEDYLKVFDNGIGAGIVFKHPCFHYDDERFKNWDCGYILGTILVMQDRSASRGECKLKREKL